MSDHVFLLIFFFHNHLILLPAFGMVSSFVTGYHVINDTKDEDDEQELEIKDRNTVQVKEIEKAEVGKGERLHH